MGLLAVHPENPSNSLYVETLYFDVFWMLVARKMQVFLPAMFEKLLG